jgi:hypothetical protein
MGGGDPVLIMHTDAHLPKNPNRQQLVVLIMHTNVTSQNMSIEFTLSKISPAAVKAGGTKCLIF